MRAFSGGAICKLNTSKYNRLLHLIQCCTAALVAFSPCYCVVMDVKDLGFIKVVNSYKINNYEEVSGQIKVL